MKLNRARRTRRPSIAWLDDKMSLMLEQVGQFNTRGFDVSPTASITEFLRMLQNHDINIAIVDIKLERGEDGRALIDLIYQSRPEIGIIVHSSYLEKFPTTRYDCERVKFVPKDATLDPVKMDDLWPLAEAASVLVDALNKQRAGLKTLPISFNEDVQIQKVFNWATVQSIRHFAAEHVTIPILVLILLLLKIALIYNTADISSDAVKTFSYEVSGFVVPYLFALALAWYFTPPEIREASSPDKFVQLHLERVIMNPSIRMNVNRQISAAGLDIPEDDISCLTIYYQLLANKNILLSRLILIIFAFGTIYLVFDIVRDLQHLFAGTHG